MKYLGVSDNYNVCLSRKPSSPVHYCFYGVEWKMKFSAIFFMNFWFYGRVADILWREFAVKIV